MKLEDAVRTRRTHKAYRPEPVDRQTLDELFELARWAPNHHLTNPWRFRVIGPRALERRKALEEKAKPGTSGKLDRAPTLGAVTARLTGDPAQDREDTLAGGVARSEEHTSELQSHVNLVCRLLLEKKKKKYIGLIDEKKKKKAYK